MGQITRLIKNFMYSLPFGLKGADTEIMGADSSGEDGTTIRQDVSDERVAKHLLKGEVTKEVEELRYRTYKVSDEASKYEYVGGSVAIKSDDASKPKDKRRHRFHQDNVVLVEGVLSTMKQVGRYGVDKYRLEISYGFTPRFRLERLASGVDVVVDEDSGVIETTLRFPMEPNPYDKTSKPFINELKRLETDPRSEVAVSIETLSFCTYKASGEDDFVNYSFLGNPRFKGVMYENYEAFVTYTWDSYIRMPVDLEAKYYSASMAEKYERKERKDVAPTMVSEDRHAYCSLCGKEMSVYDADIQRADGGRPICKECLEKALRKDG